MANRTRKAEVAEKPKKPIDVDIDADADIDADVDVEVDDEASDETSDVVEEVTKEEVEIITVRKLGGGLHTLRDGTIVKEGEIIKTKRDAIPVAFWDLFEIIK